MTDVHAIVYAYHSSPRLGELTRTRTNASLPFAGRYRLIDFALSSLSNAGVRDVGVIMQRDYQSLLDHLGSGKAWDLSRRRGGMRLLPPFGNSRGDYSGTAEALEELKARAKAAGGRVAPLAVSGGFHSPFMNEAAAEFAAVLDETAFSPLCLPAYANVTARPYGEDVRAVLKEQINHPVRWEETLRHMWDMGFDTFVEVGVGATLQKLAAKTLPQARTYAVETPAAVQALAKELGIC